MGLDLPAIVQIRYMCKALSRSNLKESFLVGLDVLSGGVKLEITGFNIKYISYLGMVVEQEIKLINDTKR